MYNTELKEKFVKWYTEKISIREACLYVFNAFEPFETQWGADLCTMDKDTLQPIVENMVGIRATSLRLRYTILRRYVTWCIDNNVPGACDGMLRVDVTGLEKMRRQTVKNPKHLQKYLDDICDPEEEQTADNTLRCIYWLAYAGLPEKDILSVRSSDVYLSSMLIKLNGEEYPIYREAIPAIQNCMTLLRFQYKHPNYGADKTVYRDRVDGDMLIRGIRAAPSSEKIIRAELSRRSRQCVENGKTELQLSYYRTWLSGLFYRTYEDELAGIPPDFLKTAADFMVGRTYRLESGKNTLFAKQKKLASEYLNDYERWKTLLL